MYHDIFVHVLSLLAILLFVLFIFILGFIVYKNKISNNRQRWKKHITSLISGAIFNAPEDKFNTKAIPRLVRNTRFRNCLINEIIQTKKNLAGDASTLLKGLYESLGLQADSGAKLKSLRWHIKARGIQELSIMEQTNYVKYIFRLTNNKNELVRNEAQCGLVNFYGFRGLRFLNVMVHPLSEWQQIQLLNKLNGTIPEDLSVIRKWLQSDNESIVIFSLKLATHYIYFDLHADVISCFKRPGNPIKIQAIKYFLALPNEKTADILLEDYHLQTNPIKLQILHALKEVGNSDHVLFLIQQLQDAAAEIIKETLATITELNPLGSLESSFIKQDTPGALVHSFNNEHAA